MARKKRKKDKYARRRQVLGAMLALLSLLLLVSLISHHNLDDARIVREVDRHLNPFEIQFRNQGGMMGAYLSYVSLSLVGWLSYFAPLALLLVALRLFSSNWAKKLEFNSFLLFVISMLTTMIANIHILTNQVLGPIPDTSGGYFTNKLTVFSITLFGEIGSYIILSGFILILLILYSSITPILAVRIPMPGRDRIRGMYDTVREPVVSFLSLSWVGSMLRSNSSSDDDDDDNDDVKEEFETTLSDEIERNNVESPPPSSLKSEDELTDSATEPSKAKRKVKQIKPGVESVQIKSVEYAFPTVDLLTENPNPDAAVSREELDFTARMLRETLETFHVGIDGEISKFPGPIITRYEFKPAAGVKVNQVINLSDDLALALKAQRIRIQAPIPGKAAIGVEIPNRNPQMVHMRDVIASEQFADSELILPIALGKTSSGRPLVTDLTKMPHLLIAGATGSGKSVCMNVLITSLLYRLHPHQVRLIMIDPKMLELSVYSGIPHLGRPVVTKPRRAEKVLSEAVVEMEKRYRRLAEASVRNIVEYNKKQKSADDCLPYIVILVDELADLMMSTTQSKTELLITRLAQMSRAVGIHLVLATQRPSVDVITGLIKANFPARIAFQVASKVDSRTIIDANGAEKLLGRGDMLFLHTGQPEPRRLHGAYLSSEDTDEVVKFIVSQGLEMFKLDGISQAKGEPSKSDVDMGDPLFKEACETVVRHKQGSVSLLQRRLGIGYQRAARLIDKLEQAGIVSPFDGSKAREVMVDQTYVDHLFTNPDVATTQPPANQNP